MRRRVMDSRAASNDRMTRLEAAAKAFKSFRPASETMQLVRAVPTVFVQYDHGTRVGGHPTERLVRVHGPSGQGKTYYTLGTCRSFLQRDNPALFVDAERTTDKAFARLVLQGEADNPLFFYRLPTTYESVVQEVREFCNNTKTGREKGLLHKDACGLIVVDSVRKLVPADQWKKINQLIAQDKDEKVRDRAAQIKAMMNAAWCDELIPLLEQTGCTMIVIARESDDPDADARTKKFGGGYITGGGKALYYDASLDIRVDRAKYVTKENGENERPTVYGTRHRITITKSKIAGMDDKTTICFFHTSNGKHVPAGLDLARDILELGRRFEIVKAAKPKAAKAGAPKKKAGGGGWLAWADQRWQGEHAAVKKLQASPDLLERLEAEVREKFKVVNPIEVTADGEVLEGGSVD